MRKLKVLILESWDYNLAGHGLYDYNHLPDELFEKRIVVRSSPKVGLSSAVYKSHTYDSLVRIRIQKFILQIKNLIKYKHQVKAEPTKPIHCFFTFPEIHVSARDILKKMGRNFTPDIIMTYWVGSFVGFKELYELHTMTKAPIVFNMLDHVYFTGGCHFPASCDHFKYGCKSCPACTVPQYAEEKLAEKLELIKKIPHTIVGTPWDCMLAKQSLVFKDSVFFHNITSPTVEDGSKNEGRKRFIISSSSFVIFIGAARPGQPRKGFEDSVRAIKEFAKDKNNVTILLLGRNVDTSYFDDFGVQVITPGYLDLKGMCDAYYASDVFLNTTLADSGPMMVNYAMKMGLPVVSYNVGTAYSFVENGKTGYKTEIGNIEGVVIGLQHIYDMNEQEKMEMSNNCKLAIKKQTEQTWWKLLYDYYSK